MKLEVEAAGLRRTIEVDEGAGGLVVALDDERVPVRLEPLAGEECARLWVDGVAHPVRLREAEDALCVTVGSARVEVRVRRALPARARRAAAGAGARRVEVRAPMPGLVVAVTVGPGAAVRAGETVAVVEAMKMQMDLSAPADGRVAEVRVRAGGEVAAGQALVVLAVEGDDR
jgi:biotin carboxyl carrier protein